MTSGSKPTSAPKHQSSRDRVRAHRERLRARGLRPIQFWVPEETKAKVLRQSQLAAQSSNRLPPDDVEQQLVTTLRQAAFIFENEKNGRIQGAIVACDAVAKFIYQRGGAAQLAGPFLQIKAAFEELDKGGKPRLFAKKSDPEKKRERSPERKHVHMLAAAALHVLVKLGEARTIAANEVAEYVAKWPGMSVQTIKGKTIIGWRDQQLRLPPKEQQSFRTLTEKMLQTQKSREIVNDLLRNGPPGMWQS